MWAKPVGQSDRTKSDPVRTVHVGLLQRLHVAAVVSVCCHDSSTVSRGGLVDFGLPKR